MTSPAIVPPPDAARRGLFLRRVWGIALRHYYLLTGSWPRLIEILYWPMINMMIWGFTSLYLVRTLSSATVMAGIFVGGVLMTEVFLRVSMSIMMFFLEEVWSRNLGHLFASPLAFFEYMGGLLMLSIVRTAIGIIPAVIVAKYMFGFSLLSVGLPLVALLLLLIFTGWWYGFLLMSLLLRFGLAAEWVAWMSTWVIIPLMAPYYPVAILPAWMQPVAWLLPPTYVFETLKALIAGKALRPDYLLISLALNAIYFVASALILHRSYQGARCRGGLLQMAE